MASVHSLTAKWLPAFKSCDEEASREIWRRFFFRLVDEARHRLMERGIPRRAEDEEDVALSVFRRVCEMAAQNDLSRIARGDDLWTLFLTVTAGKVTDLIRRQFAQKRGAGKVRGESVLETTGGTERGELGDLPFITEALAPESQSFIRDEVERFIELIPDATTRSVAERYLQGQKITEIASEIGISRQAAYRKLDVIRAIWRKESGI